MSALLEVSDLSAGYQGMRVVRDLSLTVEAGEVVCLIGPNGAGKTTTLLTISGLLPALGGEVRIDGRPINKLAPHRIARLGVAHVPDDRGLIYSMSVADNLKLAAKGAKLDVVWEHFPPLAALVKRRCGLLSGGEQQMLAIGRALVTSPRLLMVDEMSMGLAPVIVQRMLPMVRDIAKEQGCGVLLVEQHVELALEVSDRAYVLVHGELAREGAAREFLNDAATIEASYMGAERVEQS
jgi:branched-chain amino acid transport system ATP-binding protein